MQFVWGCGTAFSRLDCMHCDNFIAILWHAFSQFFDTLTSSNPTKSTTNMSCRRMIYCEPLNCHVRMEHFPMQPYVLKTTKSDQCYMQPSCKVNLVSKLWWSCKTYSDLRKRDSASTVAAILGIRQPAERNVHSRIRLHKPRFLWHLVYNVIHSVLPTNSP